MRQSVLELLRITDNSLYSEPVASSEGEDRRVRRARDSAVQNYSLSALMRQQIEQSVAPNTSNGSSGSKSAVSIHRSSRHFTVTIRYRNLSKTRSVAYGASRTPRGRGRPPNSSRALNGHRRLPMETSRHQLHSDTSRTDLAGPEKSWLTLQPYGDQNCPSSIHSIFNDLPYKGVVAFPDCLINQTEPTRADREQFQRMLAEAEVLKRQNEASVVPEINQNIAPASTPKGYYPKLLIEQIRFREFEIRTWYTAPYPEEYSQLKTLYICEYCLKYMNSPTAYERHQLKNCNFANKHPPGVEIYRDSAQGVAVWEVDGRKNIHYCQNLCLLAKLFLNSKTLYYDVEPFIFYILTEMDELGRYHFVGYFSKEKLNNSDYNVSCILTLPIYQRKGYGNFLIDFSYLLSRREFKFGTPEKPLSDLGLVSYRNYWKTTVAFKLKELHTKYLCNKQALISISLNNLCKLTGLTASDVVVGLEQLNALVKDQKSGSYVIRINLALIETIIAKWRAKKYVTLDETKLFWKPMLFGFSGGINSAPNLPPLQPKTNGEPALTSNSISNIVNFLRDDIANPYSFEDEAYKEIECYLEIDDKNKWQRSEDGNHDYIICNPGEQADLRALLETPRAEMEHSSLKEQTEKMSRVLSDDQDDGDQDEKSIDEEDEEDDDDEEVEEEDDDDDDESDDDEVNIETDEEGDNEHEEAEFEDYSSEQDDGEDEDVEEGEDEDDGEMIQEHNARTGLEPVRINKLRRLNRALQGLRNR